MNFEQLEARYRELVAQRQAGRIDSQVFDEQVGALRLQDAEQRWWQIDPASGHWLRWDGSQWLRGEPPRVQATGPQAPPAPGRATVAPASADGAMQKVLVFLQDIWRRFLDRMISLNFCVRAACRWPSARRAGGMCSV